MIKRTEHLGTFTAMGPKGGRYVLHIYQEFIADPTPSNPEGEILGSKSIKTAGGMSVNRLSKGKYQVVQTRLLLESDDPDAP